MLNFTSHSKLVRPYTSYMIYVCVLVIYFKLILKKDNYVYICLKYIYWLPLFQVECKITTTCIVTVLKSLWSYHAANILTTVY